MSRRRWWIILACHVLQLDDYLSIDLFFYLKKSIRLINKKSNYYDMLFNGICNVEVKYSIQ